MKKIIVTLLLCSTLGVFAQTETHNFITYDTTINIPEGGQWSPTDVWIVKISRPANGDTAMRPAIITMNGQGELGTTDTNKLNLYGPFYWLNNGWTGAVQLGNGTHYPILITCQYTNNVYPTPASYYLLISFLLKTYKIKPNAVHMAGLSQGAFTGGGLVEYEVTKGDNAGMKMITTFTALEGVPTQSAQYTGTAAGDTIMYQLWASKYHGRYFSLEGSGSDNQRNTWVYSEAMNRAVPGSAFFSYEDDGGGAHCCWQDMYSPFNTNWTCVGKLGPLNSPSQAGINQMGSYQAPENLFQWMLRQGDTTLVVSGAVVNKPPVAIISNPLDSVSLPSDSTTLNASQSYDPDGTIKSFVWKQLVGPIQALQTQQANGSVTLTHLAQGAYTFQLTVTDNSGATSVAQANVVERYVPCSTGGTCPAQRTVVSFSLTFINGIVTTLVTYSDGTTGSIPL